MRRFEVVRTERLVMRRWCEEDREPFAAMNADPEVMRYFPALLDRAASDALADRIEERFREQGFGLWALEVAAPGLASTELAGRELAGRNSPDGTRWTELAGTGNLLDGNSLDELAGRKLAGRNLLDGPAGRDLLDGTRRNELAGLDLRTAPRRTCWRNLLDGTAGGPAGRNLLDDPLDGLAGGLLDGLAGRLAGRNSRRPHGTRRHGTRRHREFIGFTGLNPMPYGVPGAGGMEVGWRLARHAWHQGYATEAAVAAVGVAFQGAGLAEVWSMTAAVNEPSQAVMRRLGMAQHARFDHPAIEAGHPLRPHVAYRLERSFPA